MKINRAVKEIKAPSALPDENSHISKSKSHHKSIAFLPGGDKYTTARKIFKRIFAILGVILLLAVCWSVATALNVGGVSNAPDPPSDSIAKTAFEKAEAPKYDNLKYIKDKSKGSSKVENIHVGRVVRSTSSGQGSFICETKADVTFTNSSVEAVAKMRAPLNYNSLLKSWSSGSVEFESVNYKPVAAADVDAIQKDIFEILKAYDESSATKMEGAEVTREGTLDKNGGELTFTLTKKGQGVDANQSNSTQNTTNGKRDLVKTLKVRVAWSDIEGWSAKVTWEGTKGEVQEFNDDNNDNEDLEPTKQLTCTTGDYIDLSGTVSGNSLKTDDVIKFTLDGESIVAQNITLQDAASKYPDGMYASIIGKISKSSDGEIVLTVQNDTQ